MTNAGPQTRRNSIAAEQLRGYVERVEHVRAQKKDLAEDEKLILQEAKSGGFDTNILKHCVKIRSKKPSDVADAQAMTDLYLDALGMSRELPLFRTVDFMAVDVTAKEQVVEALKKFVPANGSIMIEAGGVPVRLTRDKDGNVSATDVVVKAASGPYSTTPSPARPKAGVPEATLDQAEEMGREAARDDTPIIKNPFPFGDVRRPRWDLGWRKEAGNDGMGPDD
jgi:uncharacterized protein (UPF0335 family)